MLKLKGTFRDWLKAFILLLDELAVIAVIIIVLRFFKIEIPLPVIIMIVLIAGGLVFLTHIAVIPSFHKKQTTGKEGMIGQQVNVVDPLRPVGAVMVNGELWKAKSMDSGKIESGDDVEIVKIEGLTLMVARLKR